ncbi:MAG TPA: hypothetical protein VIG46_08260 [Candidatus Baltobacteraceae bacterium]|jgi:hypothetical protein
MRFRQFDRRARMLAQRSWTERERRIVGRGLNGRAAIAIEPVIGVLFFTFLTWGIVWRSQHVASDATLYKIAPIFGLGAVAFAIYAIAVMVAPITAFLQTFKPIYKVDGYVRYREPDEYSEDDAVGYMAALFHDQTPAGEWECFGSKRLPNRTIPALVEFSEYGGIHTIDGHPTGLLPDADLPTLAIGIAPRH